MLVVLRNGKFSKVMKQREDSGSAKSPSKGGEEGGLSSAYEKPDGIKISLDS